MEMQSVTADCRNQTGYVIENDQNAISGPAWYFNHPANTAWILVFIGLVIGISGVKYGGLSTVLISISIISIINLGFIIIKGVSDWKVAVLCMAFASLAAGLRYENEIHGFSGIEIRDIVDYSRPRLLTFQGYIIERETFTNESGAEPFCRIILRADSLKNNNTDELCRGSILVEVRADEISRLIVGQACSLTGWLEPLPEAMNPGSYSMADYWRGRGVQGTMNARNHALIEMLPDKPMIYWRYYLDRIRQRCRDCIKRAVPENQGALLEALVLGIRESVSQQDRKLFRDSGTLHLLAISGLHLQVIAVFMMWLARVLKCNLLFTAWLVILCSGFYSVLVGGSASVLRATLMTAAVSLSMLRHQPGLFWHRMLLSGCIVLWLKPSQLFDAGCQLSFFGTAGIQFATEFWSKIQNHFHSAIINNPAENLIHLFHRPDFLTSANIAAERKILSGLIYAGIILFRFLFIIIAIVAEPLFVSMVVWLFTSPLVAFHFQAINPVAIPVNLPLVPATSLALILCLAGMILSMAGVGLIGNIMMKLAGHVMSACVAILDWSLSHLMTPIAFQSPEMIDLLLIYIAICLLFVSYQFYYRNRTKINLAIILTLFILLSVSFQVRKNREENANMLEMHVFAVEHGLSILIRWPGGENWLYDCGQMGSPMVADKIVIPALNSMGIKQIDKLLISHADSDHFNGITSLLDSEIKIKSILTTPHFMRSYQPDAVALKERINEKKVLFQSVKAGEYLIDNMNSSAKVLHPSAEFAQFKADNSTSLVIEIQSNGINCILTGDLEGHGLSEMVEFRENHNKNSIGCHVMVAPHHGGIQSNPEWFYQAFQPAIVITSQGRGRFGLASSLESQLKAFSPDTRLFVTARDGAIALKWTKEGLKASTFREGKSAHKPAGRAEPLKGRDTWPAE